MNNADIECFHYRKHVSIIRKNFPLTKLFGFDVPKIFGAGLWTILQAWGDELQIGVRPSQSKFECRDCGYQINAV
jgi:hypothetical protein